MEREKRIKDICERLTSISETPWVQRGAIIASLPLAKKEDSADEYDYVSDSIICGLPLLTHQVEKNADFITNAPSDISFLLDELVWLEQLLSDRVQESDLVQAAIHRERIRCADLVRTAAHCPRDYQFSDHWENVVKAIEEGGT